MSKMKITPADVLTTLREKKHATRAEIAEALGCSVVTVSGKIKKLIGDGEDIGFNHYGIFILNKEDVANADERNLAKEWFQSIIRALQMWAKRGKSHRAIAVEIRKRFPKEFTKEELVDFKGGLFLVTRAVDAILLDKELE